ncbi:MAG: gliding motility-associated C-terminal domain-containing protein [Saprospiraceae bacterium]
MKISLFALGMLLACAATAQQLTNASGSTLVSATMTVEYSIGEPIIATLLAGDEAATQGLLQPDGGELDCATVLLQAEDDLFKIESGQNLLTFNPLTNDAPGLALTPPEIVAQPSPGNGTLTNSGETDLVFQLTNLTFDGVDSCRYRVCLQACPTVCDEARVILSRKSSSYVITPNDDQFNAWFNPVFEKNITVGEAELTVFNRWGEIIFREKGPEPKWDGKDPEGRPVPQATYYYSFKARLPDGTELPPDLGTLTVLR